MQSIRADDDKAGSFMEDARLIIGRFDESFLQCPAT
jgi:hypothetical protein